MRSFLLVALLALAGCSVTPPATSVRTPSGVVRADEFRRARQVADASARLGAEIRGLLPDARDRVVEVWVQDEIEIERGRTYPRNIAGMADHDRGRIHLRADDPRIELHLVHELVHVLLGPSWGTLPGILEEGLCDLAAARLVEPYGREHHVKRLVEAAALFGGCDLLVEIAAPSRGMAKVVRGQRLSLTFDELTPLAPREALALEDHEVFEQATTDDGAGLYGLGYLVTLAIVDRDGFEGLHDLCARAAEEGLDRVPVAWVLEAAGIDGGEESFRCRIRELLGPEDLVVLGEMLADELAQATVEMARGAWNGTDDERFLKLAQPSVGMPDEPGRASLSGIRAFREAVHARWARDV